jgi:glycosyltransferase involved in cell wall biosynthesis
MGWDLRGIMIQTNLVEDEDYKLLPKEFELEMAEVDVVNKIYNASDVYLTTTLGEGWGLGYSEAASCRVPIIAPYSTSFMEMSNYGKNAFMVYNLYPYCNVNDNVIRQQTDIFEIADKIVEVAKKLYSNDKEIDEKVERNMLWVRNLEWSKVTKSWVDYFKQVF